MKVNLKLQWLLFVGGMFILQMSPAFAQRVTSPSVSAAARLKNKPPQNWLRHYLGDDRYKISGGVWKVVSTQTDNRYHRANCVFMLRSSAAIVIGFASPTDAMEAGYKPDTICKPPQMRSQQKDADLDFANPYFKDRLTSRRTGSGSIYPSTTLRFPSVYSGGSNRRDGEYDRFRRNAGGLFPQPGR